MAYQLVALQRGVGADLRRHTPPEYVHLDPRSGHQFDRQVAVGDVAPDGVPVGAAADPADERTIGIDGLATVDGDVVLLADQQCAQTPLDARRLCCDQHLPPVEVALVEANAEPKPGLQWIVEQGEVRPVIAVTLLYPQRVQRSVSTWPNANGLPSGQQAIPHLHRDIGLEIKLPPQLADVGHALGENVESLDADVACLHEREAVLRDVVIGHALQDLTGTRAPHPDNAQLLRRLADVNWPVLVALLQPKPPKVAVHISGTGHQPEPVRGETGDSNVPRDPPAAVEELGVNDTAHRPVDQVARDTFEQRQRPRAVQLDLPE